MEEAEQSMINDKAHSSMVAGRGRGGRGDRGRGRGGGRGGGRGSQQQDKGGPKEVRS